MADASPPEIAPLPAVMSTEEVSELLGLTPKWTLRLAREGHLPGHQVPNGRRWVFRADEVLDAISSWSDAGRGADGGRVRRGVANDPGPGARVTSPHAPGSISCPAPPKQHHQPEAEWMAECARAWIAAAAAAGVRAVDTGHGEVLVGAERFLLIITHSEVEVLDDLGDVQVADLATVAVEPTQ